MIAVWLQFQPLVDFNCPEDATRNAERRRWNSGSGSGNTEAWSGSRGGSSKDCFRSGPPPSGASVIYYLHHLLVFYVSNWDLD